MNAKDFSLNNSADAEIIKDLSAVFPWICITVFSNGFIVKSVDSCDLSSLMVTSE